MGMLGQLLSAAKSIPSGESRVSTLIDMLSKKRRDYDGSSNLKVWGYHLQGGRPPYLCFEALKEKIDFSSVALLMYQLKKRGLCAKIEMVGEGNQTFYEVKDSVERHLFLLHVYSNNDEDSKIVSLEISCDLPDVLKKKEFETLEKALSAY